jgi:chemotaxis response regulator CheB
MEWCVVDDFTLEEQDLLLRTVSKITGRDVGVNEARFSIMSNVKRKMDELHIEHFSDYLQLIHQHDEEMIRFISVVTVHTTSWFRELPHFQALEEFLQKWDPQKTSLRVLSLACSTGEEVYSLALVLEFLRTSSLPWLKPSILGVDIDLLSIERAKKAIYDASHIEKIPAQYHRFLKKGKGRAEGLFTMTPEIRAMAKFQQGNLLHLPGNIAGSFDVIFCRNVLIYVNEATKTSVVGRLAKMMTPKGLVCFGHNEYIDSKSTGLLSLGHSTYIKEKQRTDVRVMDLALPTASTTDRIATRSSRSKIPKFKTPQIVVLGASTGGTEALAQVLTGVGRPDSPPVLVTQHIAPEYLKPFLVRLSRVSGLEIGKDNHGAPLKRGHIYAHPDSHMGVSERDGNLFLNLSKGPPVCGHKPSVEYMFTTASRLRQHQVLGILMTGMGRDGAGGMLKMHTNGAFTVAQDEKSSVVFGMPKEAIALGGVDFVGNLDDIHEVLRLALF